jgi:lipopolysaccharide export system protein LptA
MKHWVLLWLLFPTLAWAAANRFDSKQPIEITSDTLEVLQQQNMAIFSGNVVAIQQDVRLKSDRMVVYYANASEKTPPAKTESKTPPTKQSVQKIEVEGNVFLSTPEETASGARGDYDVIGEEIHLWDNVVLTRGGSTLKGNQLTYNFASGRSIVTGGTVATQGASKGKERVRALFVPDQKAKTP